MRIVARQFRYVVVAEVLPEKIACSLCAVRIRDGMLINEWSGDGYDRYHSAYGYFNGSLIPGFSSAGREQYLKLDFQRFIEDET